MSLRIERLARGENRHDCTAPPSIPAIQEGCLGLVGRDRAQDLTQVAGQCMGARCETRGGCWGGNWTWWVTRGAFSHDFNAAG